MVYRHCCYDALTVAVVVWAAASFGRPCRTAAAAFAGPLTTATVGEPLVVTFEGGETATAPADDTVYLTEEVATLNATARDAGDYVVYDDYNTATDKNDVPTTVRNRGREHLSKSAKHVKTNGTAADAAAAPVPDATSAAAAFIAVPVSTVTQAADDDVRTTHADRTNQINAVSAVDVESITGSGSLMQMAVPPGYRGTVSAVVMATTTPMSDASSGTAPRRRSAWSHLAGACIVVVAAAVFV